MIPHNKPTLGKSEILSTKKIIQSGLISQGDQVKCFESELANMMGINSENVVCVSSGSAAIYIALRMISKKNNSKYRIGIPSYSCSSLWHSAKMVGGKPIIIDSKRYSANIDINSLKNKNLNTAIVPHMFGLPIKIPKNKFSFPIIEDCAQALGARINDEPVGLQTDIGIFSFYATKIITSGGQGGALISKNTDIAENARDFRDFDYKSINKERFNFQMTDLQASIGRIQLSKLNNFIKKREQLFKYYRYFGVDLIGSNLELKSKNKPVRYRAVKKIKNPKKMIKYLEKNDVKSIVPINDWELLADGKTAPCAYDFSKNTISLPLYPSLQKRDIRYIADLINNYEKK